HLASRAGMRSMPAGRARAAAAAFVEEYFRHAPSTWRERLPLHTAGAFLEVAAGIFRAQEPGWRETAAWIIEAAQRACRGVPDWPDQTRDQRTRQAGRRGGAVMDMRRIGPRPSEGTGNFSTT